MQDERRQGRVTAPITHRSNLQGRGHRQTIVRVDANNSRSMLTASDVNAKLSQSPWRQLDVAHRNRSGPSCYAAAPAAAPTWGRCLRCIRERTASWAVACPCKCRTTRSKHSLRRGAWRCSGAAATAAVAWTPALATDAGTVQDGAVYNWSPRPPKQQHGNGQS
jgi:hypothetical protein